MSEFAYKALGRDGRESSGTLTAESRSAALSLIMDKGLHPVSVEERGANGGAGANENGNGRAGAGAAGKAEAAAANGRVSQKAVEGFTRELANLLSGGVPLSRA